MGWNFATDKASVFPGLRFLLVRLVGVSVMPVTEMALASSQQPPLPTRVTEIHARLPSVILFSGLSMSLFLEILARTEMFAMV
jgi:hypothetical protein